MQTTFSVPSIHCNHCAKTIKLELGDLLGISDVAVNVEEKNVSVTYAPPVTDQAIKNLLTEIGYPAK